MSRKKSFGYFLCAILLSLIANALAEPQSNSSSTSSPTSSSTTAVPTTTPKPIDIFASEICKKCSCKTIGATNQLNCTARLVNAGLTSEDWKLLQHGDKKFQIIMLQRNNLSSIQKFPEYPVQHLYLGFNRINNISEAAFQNLTELTRLDLSYNLITSKTLDPQIFLGSYSEKEVQPLGKLRDLNLCHNNLHSLSPDVFLHVPDLENLTLSKNIFKIIDVPTQTALASLPSLKHLDLSYTEIKALPPTILHTDLELDTLILAGNLFTEIPEQLQLATNLRSLNLDDNPIVEISGNNVFPKMPNMRSLSISYMEDLTSFGNGSFINLGNLTVLYASDNEKLSFIHPMAFSKPTNLPDYYDYVELRELYLNNNNLSFVDRSWFARWDRIQVIDFRFNPWNCNCSNTWFIENLLPEINRTKPNFVENVDCGLPLKWKGKPLMELYVYKYNLPCDFDESKNNVVLACILVFVLVIVPIAIGSIVLYRRGCLGLRTRYASRNERALYSRTTFTDDFHI